MNTFRGLDELVKNEKKKDYPIKGVWSHIRWTPDFVTGEQIAIGVMLNVDGRIYTQFIEDFSRLECVYDESMSDYAKNIISLIERTLRINPKYSISDQIIYDVRGFTQGGSVQEILTRLFDRAVPIGRPHDAPDTTMRFQSIRTSNLWIGIQYELQQLLQDNYSLLIPEDPQVKIVTPEGQAHFLDIPIRPVNSKKLAKVISSVYANIDTIENHYLNAVNHIDIAIRNNIGEHPALFVLKAKAEDLYQLDAASKIRATETISELDWQIRAKGYELFEADNQHELSEMLVKFGGIQKSTQLKLNTPNNNLIH